MKLLILSGFLGSGKTTLLLRVARELVKRGLKIAIIENEIGQSGVDDELLKAEGLDVKEIFSGCICCSLRQDLVTTMLQLEREQAPDVVVLEPSGVAAPRILLRAFDGYGGEIDGIKMVCIVDAVRFQKINDLSIPIITDGIETSEFILLNKVDAVDEAAQSEVVARIHGVKADADVIPVSGLDGRNVEQVYERLMDFQPATETAEKETVQGPKPTVFATKCEFAITDEATDERLKGLVVQFAGALEEVGCSLIGNLKMILKTGTGGYMATGITNFGDEPVVRGRLNTGAETVELTVNAIVYSVTKNEVQLIAERVLSGI